MANFVDNAKLLADLDDLSSEEEGS